MSVHPSDNEERYFAAENAEKRRELRKKAEKAAAALKEQAGIGEAVGTEDADIVKAIQELGFTGHTARVFPLLPLVHVAWADGKVQRKERATIMEVVEKMGIADDAEASAYLASLLDEKPDQAFFDVTLPLIRKLSSGAPAGNLVEMCIKVASASSGLLGLGLAINDDERLAIDAVATGLGAEAHKAFAAYFGYEE